MTRKEKILINIKSETQIGLEIGPLSKPIITREMGNVRYVDHATTEELRKKCAPWGTVDLSKIVNVDYVWGEKSLKELTINEYPFDYVLASHVIEHVPDFIGWLKEIRSVLKTGGILSLAIPDKRFTFDYLRNLTKPADILEAYLLQSKQPSLKQIFDYKSEFVHRNKEYMWSIFGFKEKLIYEHSLNEAWEITKNAFSNKEYTDVHCWVFTDISFLELVKTLVNLDMFDFKIARFFPRTGHEFFVSLEALDSNLNKDDRLQIQFESINNIKKKINKPFRRVSFDYRSWKIVNILHFIKRKFTN